MKNKKILIYFFTGKRGGFSHFVPLLRQINLSNKVDYKIIVADMHLSSFFGNTVNEIKNYSKKLILLERIQTKDTVSNRLSVISKTIKNLSKIFEKKKPNYLFLLGDRAEVLGAAIAGMHFNIPVILGSATPSLESFNQHVNNKYKYLTLKKRAGNAKLPSMHLIDLNKDHSEDGLSKLLIKSMNEHIENDGQILVFINRRGYAPTLICKTCN